MCEGEFSKNRFRSQLPEHVSVKKCYQQRYFNLPNLDLIFLKVVTSEKIGGSKVISTLGTWYGGVVMGVLLPFYEAAILYRHFNCAPLQKQKIIVFAVGAANVM